MQKKGWKQDVYSACILIQLPWLLVWRPIARIRTWPRMDPKRIPLRSYDAAWYSQKLQNKIKVYIIDNDYEN